MNRKEKRNYVTKYSNMLYRILRKSNALIKIECEDMEYVVSVSFIGKKTFNSNSTKDVFKFSSKDSIEKIESVCDSIIYHENSKKCI